MRYAATTGVESVVGAVEEPGLRTRIGRDLLRNARNRCASLRTKSPLQPWVFASNRHVSNPLYFPYKEEVGGSSPSTPTIGIPNGRGVSDALADPAHRLGFGRSEQILNIRADSEFIEAVGGRHLLLRVNVAVVIQHGSHALMAEAFGDGRGVDALGNQERNIAVPQVVEAERITNRGPNRG